MNHESRITRTPTHDAYSFFRTSRGANYSSRGVTLIDTIVGIALNGTSSVLYGSVPDLVTPAKRQRAFGIFYTGTIGAGAVSPAIYGLLGDAVGVTSALVVVAAVVLLTLPITLVLRPALVTATES